MEEKILIKSYHVNVKKLFKIFLIIGIALSIILATISTIALVEDYNYQLAQFEELTSDPIYQSYKPTYDEHQEAGACYVGRSTICYRCQVVESTLSQEPVFNASGLIFSIIPLVALLLLWVIICIINLSYDLTVTDKRIYAKALWIKHISLPLDLVSATSSLRLFGGISVSTASGRIVFLFISNAIDIYNTINNLLIERQK